MLVEILLDVPRLHQQSVRHDLLQSTGRHLDRDGRPFSVPDDSDAEAHLRAVVRAARRRGALVALKSGLSAIEPDDMATAWFRLAVTALTSRSGPLSADTVLELVDLLRRCPTGYGQRALFAYLAERRAARRPLHDRGLPQVLYRLFDARVPPGDPDAPRRDMLRFLRLLAAEAEPGAPDLTVFLASVLDGTPQVPVAAAPRQPGDGRQVVLQIRVEEEDAPNDLPYTRRRYSLHGYHYEGDVGAEPGFHCSWPSSGLVTGDELASSGRDFLAAWEDQEELGWGPDRRVEFLLPDSLLGRPVELWPHGTSGVPLSRSCHVVVRSLRRYKDTSIHYEWDQRWKALDRDCPPGDALRRIGWMSPRGADSGETGRGLPESTFPPLSLSDPGDVEDWLREHPGLACLGLGMPYDHGDPLIRDAVLDALLEDGIPVMVWRRDAGDPCDLVGALRRGTPPVLLAELPDRVLRERRRERREPLVLGKQITLLWDDPTCVFRRQDSQMSGPGGADDDRGAI